jgi:RloB-like protein
MSRQQRTKSNNNRSRPHGRKPLRESFLIFCEGATEVGYFGSFKKRAKFVPGGNALKIVQNAVAYKDTAEKKVDQYWAVFDKDETSDEQFDQAIELAKANHIRVAWSNQAFECWIILHYRDFSHPCHRKDYESMLKRFIPEYDASEKGEEQGRRLHLRTASLLATALVNAKRGHTSFHPDLRDGQKQTCTLIYTLVEAILANG